jgi:phosphatidylglycerophosphate synthase
MLPDRWIWIFGQMAFREVAVTAIREVMRVRRAGAGLRKVTAQAWVDRKTWQAREGGAAQLASIIGAATDPVHQLDTT